MNTPRSEEIEREVADYERRLREQLLREHELAELATQQQAVARTKTFLPMFGGTQDHGSAGAALNG